MLNKFIVFVGLSGSGKSFYAKKLAKKLNIKYFDLDKEIEQKHKKIISDIFKTHDESFFRKQEEIAFFNIINNCKPTIISLGGGSLNNKSIKQYVNNNCFCIYLDKKIHKIYKVVKNNKRPLLLTNVKNTLKNMLNKRVKDYKTADLTINCNKRKSHSKQIKNIVKYLYSNKIIQN